jgi:hypothetical protein
MTDNVRAKDVEQTIDRVQKLVALAQSDDVEEARTAAVQATRLIHEQKLVCIPEEALERMTKEVQGSRALATAQAKAEGQKNLLIGLALGFFGGKRI